MSTPIRPENESLAELLPEIEGPVVMVNFLRFKPGGGSRAYGRYAEAFGKMLEAAGGRFLFRGRVEGKIVGDVDWHAIALVEYPSRQSVIDLLTSPEYEAIHHLREQGLEQTLLYATRER